jgi:hypothetical protein
MFKLIVGTLLAALAMFVWGAIYWAVLPTMPLSTETVQSDDALGTAMLASLPKSGTYTVPDLHGDVSQLEQKHLKGPIAIIHFHREGMAMMDPGILIRGFLHGWAAVAVAALVLQMCLPALPSYCSRLWFFASIGLLMAVFKDGGGAVWRLHSAKWAGVEALYDVLAWVVAGLVLAKFLKPAPTAAA